ncbi:cytochrome c-type biogenesis protein [Aliiruegeria sabulilitoris]|uniref:cytochrome c-type biogenesis protein n=1 Tax=Aliiruegeria sabulilitoris TaxID=1510458 RepID=UPI0009E6BF84|nr:cytochrome c-type biogenesis protein [Aliiruegeria sabulilitoris]NDR56779.1 cytochrome c-type biogenesis protein CcmH [Pseudoruegeria sp. M32A2M]
MHIRSNSRNERGIRSALLALGLCLLATAALALDPAEMFEDPEKEARAREIGRELRCLVCQNQSIFDSNAGLAHDLRVVVRERMEAGDSDAEVLEYVRSRFGDYVLLEPPVTAQTTLLWLAPIGFIALGALAMLSYLRGRPKPANPLPELTEEETAEARRLLEETRT